MRLIGVAERALERMCRRTASRVAFGTRVSDETVTRERIAEARRVARGDRTPALSQNRM
jgi:acyl-CoA dehydrogenase